MNNDEQRTRIKNTQQDKTVIKPINDKTRILNRTSPKLSENDDKTRLSTDTHRDIDNDINNDSKLDSVNTSTSINPASVESITRGKVINNRFVIQDSLGAGGMGMVFRAIDKRKEETGDKNPFVAMKILSNEFKSHPQAFVSLQREAQKSQLLAHPNIITVYDFDRDGDLVYLTMEELKGQPLDELIREYDQGLPTQMAVEIIQSIGEGLAYAHRKNIVHADLKPANIFYTQDKQVKIIDFGIAKMVTDLDSQSEEQEDYDPAEIDGLTPAYASLEMINGERTVLSDDVYALGIIAYEVLTGRHPFSNKSALIAKTNELSYKKYTKLKSFQWAAIKKALLFERKERFQSALEFLNKFSGSGRRVRYLSFGIILLSLVLAVSIIIPNTANTDYLYDELSVTQQNKFNDLLKEGNEILGFNDWNNALSFFDQAFAILPKHSRTTESINLAVEKILNSLNDVDDEMNNSLKLQQINELLKYDSLKDNEKLLEYKQNIVSNIN